jgi:ABC-type nitrate/sulfonate/bicarbonate transport system substrate-binding protein/anti-anti-sigma regulatory factor
VNEGQGDAGSADTCAHLRVAYVPIVCAAPLLYAVTSGLFERHGLSVELHKAPSWDGVRRLVAFGKVDAAHILAPLSLATGLGIMGRAVPLKVAAILNQHGSAFITSARRGSIESARSLVGLTLAVPHRFSMHYYLLCDWLARGGVNPLRDVRIIELPPPRMPRWFSQGKIDAAMIPEPYAQMLVDRGDGLYAFSTREVWTGHPCCAFAFAPALWQQQPLVAHELLTALVEAEADLMRMGPQEKRLATKPFSRYMPAIATDAFTRVLAGDPIQQGLPPAPDRITFSPTPHVEYGIWILAQMQRWGQIEGPIDHRKETKQFFDTDSAALLSAKFDVFPEKPNLADVAPFSFDDPFGSVERAPFCAYRQALPRQQHEFSEPVRQRMTRILERLAEVAGGLGQGSIEAVYDDELGELERALDEALRAREFAEEAVVEQIEQQDQADKQAAVISAQQALIHELGAPIVPVLPGVLLVPLVGRIDEARAMDIEERVLSTAWTRSAKTVLIDVTGVPTLEGAALGLVQRVSQALDLLGTLCILVGVSASAARALVIATDQKTLPRCERDLSSAISKVLKLQTRG